MKIMALFQNQLLDVFQSCSVFDTAPSKILTFIFFVNVKNVAEDRILNWKLYQNVVQRRGLGQTCRKIGKGSSFQRRIQNLGDYSHQAYG